MCSLIVIAVIAVVVLCVISVVVWCCCRRKTSILTTATANATATANTTDTTTATATATATAVSSSLPAIYYINLDRSPDRNKYLQEALRKRNLWPATRVSAVDGAQLQESTLRRVYNSAEARKIHGRDLKQAEIGCSMSHAKVWRKHLADPEHAVALVLESDADVSACSPRVLRNIMTKLDKVPRWGMCQLHLPRNKPNKVKIAKGLYSVPSGCSGTYGYLISNHGARVLMKGFLPIKSAADGYTARTTQKHKDFMICTDRKVVGYNAEFPSTIL